MEYFLRHHCRSDQLRHPEVILYIPPDPEVCYSNGIIDVKDFYHLFHAVSD